MDCSESSVKSEICGEQNAGPQGGRQRMALLSGKLPAGSNTPPISGQLRFNQMRKKRTKSEDMALASSVTLW
jgi:hypothetical protein